MGGLADLRSRFYGRELSDPRVIDRLIGYTRAEVGDQGPEAQQAFIESVLNRGISRDQPLAKVLSGSYFPDVTHSRADRPVSEAERAKYGPLIQSVLGGSNVTNYATGNASGSVGFAGGPQTAAYGGERYGVEGPDRNWWLKAGEPGPQAGYIAGNGVSSMAKRPGYSPPNTQVASAFDALEPTRTQWLSFRNLGGE